MGGAGHSLDVDRRSGTYKKRGTVDALGRNRAALRFDDIVSCLYQNDIAFLQYLSLGAFFLSLVAVSRTLNARRRKKRCDNPRRGAGNHRQIEYDLDQQIMTIRDDLKELRAAYVFDECYVLGFHCEPQRLVLRCELQPATARNATGVLSPHIGEISISGVEALQFDLTGRVGASGDDELDIGGLDLELTEAGLLVHTAVGSISVLGRDLTVQSSPSVSR